MNTESRTADGSIPGSGRRQPALAPLQQQEAPWGGHRVTPEPGRWVYGAAVVALGLVGLAWGDFTLVWQPIPDGMPARTGLAYLTSLALIASGVAIQLRGGVKTGGIALFSIFMVFGILWIPRIINHLAIFGVWAGAAEQIATAIGGLILFLGARDRPAPSTGPLSRAARKAFGICAIMFGFSHFLALKVTAAMVPSWIFGGGLFWAAATGVAHAAAGIAILTGRRAVLASGLLTAMFLGFGLLVWIPILATSPHDHTAWAGNAVNLALAGAAWIVNSAFREASRDPTVSTDKESGDLPSSAELPRRSDPSRRPGGGDSGPSRPSSCPTRRQMEQE